MAEEYIVTQEGYDKIKAEYDELVSVRRQEVAEHLKEARSYGDLSENAEYDAAKDEQVEVEARIQKLENMIKNAKIADDADNGFVGVGSKVKIKNLDEGKVYEYLIVGSSEADPFAEPTPKISNESLVGQALIGKKKKDEVDIETPDGTVRYQITAISR